jgi:hypothetical protein
MKKIVKKYALWVGGSFLFVAIQFLIFGIIQRRIEFFTAVKIFRILWLESYLWLLGLIIVSILLIWWWGTEFVITRYKKWRAKQS